MLISLNPYLFTLYIITTTNLRRDFQKCTLKSFLTSASFSLKLCLGTLHQTQFLMKLAWQYVYTTLNFICSHVSDKALWKVWENFRHTCIWPVFIDLSTCVKQKRQWKIIVNICLFSRTFCSLHWRTGRSLSYGWISIETKVFTISFNNLYIALLAVGKIFCRGCMNLFGKLLDCHL